jgi:glutamate synthase domain-containing protein 2
MLKGVNDLSDKTLATIRRFGKVVLFAAAGAALVAGVDEVATLGLGSPYTEIATAILTALIAAVQKNAAWKD